jgi:hypothetical protein
MRTTDMEPREHEEHAEGSGCTEIRETSHAGSQSLRQLYSDSDLSASGDATEVKYVAPTFGRGSVNIISIVAVHGLRSKNDDFRYPDRLPGLEIPRYGIKLLYGQENNVVK